MNFKYSENIHRIKEYKKNENDEKLERIKEKEGSNSKNSKEKIIEKILKHKNK